jgi:two-component system sensor histidine kinase TctE
VNSISRQLVFWLAVPLTLVALCGALVHYFNSVAPQVIGTDRHLKELAGVLARQIDVENGRLSVASDPTATAQWDPAVQFAVRDQEQKLLAGDGLLPVTPIDGAARAVYSTARFERRNVRILASRIDTPAGPVFVTVAAALNNDAAARFGFMSTLLWDFVQLDLTLVLVWVGIQLGLRPVKRLRDEIAERSPLDLRPVLVSAVPREIAPLAATLNRLFLMLRTQVQSQQQFIANTAHQLRTPITGMLAQLDLLLADPAAQAVKPRLTMLQEGVRQLAHSANQLLTLARADPAVNIAAKNQSVDLCAIAGDVVAKFFDRALQAEIDLGAELHPASLSADASLLDDLLNNLVDNALKYTPAGGRVTVGAGRHDGRPYLAVEDSGPGIPAAERQRVRQRFYRLPNSPGHGSGLGLAIVEEIARLYDAEVSIEPGAGDIGTRVTVRFPEAAAPAG